MSEEDREVEAKELTEEEKCEKFVDSWLFPDHKVNTEEERKAHELMDGWHKEWLEARKEKRSFQIFAPKGQEALLKAWHKRKQLHPQPVFDQLQQEYFDQLKEEEEQQKKEKEQKLEEVRKKQQLELAFQRSQIPLMVKDEMGLKFVELQVEALKCFVQYVKDIQYCLPLHMSVKPYADIVKHLRSTIALIGVTKTMDENWIAKYGREVESIKNELIQIDKNVKKRRKQMIYL